MSETNEQGTTGATEEVTTTVDKTKEKRVRIKRSDFMRAWEETVAGLKNGNLTGSGVQIVAEKLGLKKTSVSQRATKYRTGYGIPLSNMPRPRGSGSTFNADDAKAELAKIQAELAVPTDNKDTEIVMTTEA